MYRKNTAGQFVCFQGVDATTGGIKSGVTWTVRRCIDGTFAAATGTVAEDGTTGWYKFAISQADCNGNNCSYNFTGTGAIPQTVNIVTTAADPTDSVRLGLTALPNVAAGGNGGLPTGDGSGRVLLQPSQPGVTIPTVTTLTNLPAIPANWLTAAGIAAAALNGKGDWLTALPAIPANWITASGIAAGALNGKGDWLTATGYNSTPPWYTAPDNPTDYARDNVTPSWYTSPDNANITYLRNYADADRVIDVGVSPWAEVLFLRGTATELVRKKLRDVSGVGVLSDQTVIGSAKDA